MNVRRSNMMLVTCALLWVWSASGPSAGDEPDDQTAKKSVGNAIADVKHDGPVDFEGDILPILRRNCLSCHNKTDAENDLVLESPQTILAGGSEGPSVTPGDSSKSLLLKLAARQAEPYMPPEDNKVGAKNLTSNELGLLKLWIDQGAQGEVKGTDAPLQWEKIPAGFQPIYAIAISPQGDYVAAGRGNRVSIYHVPTKKLVNRLSDPELVAEGEDQTTDIAHRAIVRSLAFSPDGSQLSSGAYRHVKIWRRQPDAEQWKLERTITATGATGPLVGRVSALSFHPDGNRLAVGGGQPSRAGGLTIWNVEDGQMVREFSDPHRDTILGVRFSPDGKLVASCGADNLVKIFDAQSGQLQKTFRGHSHHVLGVSWRADGQLLASCGADKVIRVWDVQKGEQKGAIGGFRKDVTSVHFLGTSDNLVASSGDGTVVTRQSGGAAGPVFKGNQDFVYSVHSSADGKTIVAGGQDGVVRVWQAGGELIVSFEPPGRSEDETAPQENREASIRRLSETGET